MSDPREVLAESQTTLIVGVACKLGGGAGARNWWHVQARGDRYTILTTPVAFQPSGTLAYTIIDWEKGVRGPCNLIGQGWGDGSYTPEQCREMLAELEAGDIEVSHRNNVPIDVTAVRA